MRLFVANGRATQPISEGQADPGAKAALFSSSPDGSGV